MKKCYTAYLLLISLLAISLSFNAWGIDIPWLNSGQNKSVYTSKQVRAELVAYAPQGVVIGADVWFGLKIEHQPTWHTYWQNPGDVGLATQLTWILPEGLSAGEIVWPTPKVLPVAQGLVDYGYEDTVLLPIRITVTEQFYGAEVPVELQASWLSCQVACIPESHTFFLTIPANAPTISEYGLFESAWRASPQVLDGVQASVTVVATEEDGQQDTLEWRVTGLPPSWHGQMLQLFPEQASVIVNTGPDEAYWQDNIWVGQYALSVNRVTEPEQLSGVLLVQNENEEVSFPFGITLAAPVEGIWPAQHLYTIPPSLYANDTQTNGQTDNTGNQQEARLSDQTDQNGANEEVVAPQKITLFEAVVFAFLGGLVLNLMPCVFPVLSIKALSFAETGKQSHQAQKIAGLAYGVGVILTMLALACLVMVLRTGGVALAWGFQLQSPIFVAALAGLFMLISLSLLGVFEIKVFLPQSFSNLRGKTPAVDSFLTGIISVLVAAPCSAPLMGAAVGLAFILPTAQALLIFLVLGFGLALPLMIIAFIPRLGQFLPKPGAWMQTFRQFLAFPMLATVLWLLWVLGLQTNVNVVIGVLVVLLALALFAWVLGWQQRSLVSSKLWKLGVVAFSMLLLGLSLNWVLPALSQEASPAQTNWAATPSEVNVGVGVWRPWSRRSVDEALAQGHPVFIDFTAAWCITCQANKMTTLTRPQVLQAFTAKGVMLFEADWTNADPEITHELERYGRSGVPLYVLLQSGHEPIILPEILTPHTIDEALENI